MVEVQSHGFTFERWVRDALFGGYSGEYGQEWDVPAMITRDADLPADVRGLPVSIKTAKFGSPISLGDILRQRTIGQSFLMVVGFWHQCSAEQKRFEEIGWAGFSVSSWQTLWGGLTSEQLGELDAKVKSFGPGSHGDARQFAKNWKAAHQERSHIVINPKIDSRNQRRIQCSLPFKVFWEYAGRKPERRDRPLLFGRAFDNPVLSPPRSFR